MPDESCYPVVNRIKAKKAVVAEHIDQLIIYEGTKHISAGDLLEACQAQVKSLLYNIRHKYDSKLYIHRAIERELNAFLDAPHDEPAPYCFLIVAPAGSGKTNLLCDLARVRMERQPVLLLMGDNIYLDENTGLLGTIKEELEAASSRVSFRSAGDTLHALHRLAEEVDQDALIILDAINEYSQPIQMRKAIEDFLRKTRRHHVKLVVTCRDYYWGLFQGSFWEGVIANKVLAEADQDNGTEIDFNYFAEDEHTQALNLYLSRYNIIGRPIGDAAEQCRHPLLLRFFCEAYSGQDVGEVQDIRLKELFDRYWNQKLASIAERMVKQGNERLQDGLAAEAGSYLLDLASYMLHLNARAIPLAEMSQATGYQEQYDDPRSIYGRIRDEFIILEEKVQGTSQRKMLQVAFVYEQFMEYAMARSLIRDWDRMSLEEVDILAEIDLLVGKYEEFAQLLGVMVYLALILKEERHIALWSHLYNRGPLWQKTIFETFRKLSVSQIDSSVFDALNEMLTTENDDIQKQVLEVLKLTRVGQRAPASTVDMVCKLASNYKNLAICRRALLALGNMM